MSRPWLFIGCALVVALSGCSQPCLVPPAPEAPSREMNFLHAAGEHIVNERGERVQLRGCNTGGWLLIEPWILGLENQPGIECEKDLWDVMVRRFGRGAALDLIRMHREGFFNESDVRRVAEAGMNCLRIPIWWRAVSDPEYGGEMAYLDRCVEWCAQYGVYAIIDLHGAPGTQSTSSTITGERSKAELWTSGAFKDQTVAWWKAMAARYRDQPAVAGYDLINEAFSAPQDQLMRFYDVLYRAVREADPRHLVILEDGLLGFHRMPMPADMGWTNVAYSFHYYPQSVEEATTAPGAILHRFRRAALQYGVPILVGEFNTIELVRGGAEMFRRYAEVFEYYGWAWTFWTYKKIEENRDTMWGLYGVRDPFQEVDLEHDSLERIRSIFESMETSRVGEQVFLKAALGAPSRWPPAESPTAGEGRRIELSLRDALVIRGEGGAIRIEWGWTLPNVGNWDRADSVAWQVDVPQDGVYELGASLANDSDSNRMRVRIDSVQATDVPVANTKGWRRYEDRALGFHRMAKGRHVIEYGQADTNSSFVNLRCGWLRPVSEPPQPCAGESIRLNPLTMERPPAASPVRVEWMNDPPNLANWRSGEKASWRIELPAAGRYRARASFATVESQTSMRLLVDGKRPLPQPLAGTGGWQVYQWADLGVLELPAGAHAVEVVWENANGGDAGNLREVMLVRE
jgi:endoglucanase